MKKMLKKLYFFGLLILFTLLLSLISPLSFNAYANSVGIILYLDNFEGNISIHDEIGTNDNDSLSCIDAEEDSRSILSEMYGDEITFCIMPTNPFIEYQVQIAEGEIEYFAGNKFFVWIKDAPSCYITLGVKQEEADEPPAPLMLIVEFDIGGGTTLDEGLLIQEVAEGGSAIEPDIIPPEGYTFQGWDTSFTDISSDIAVDGKITIKAEYEILKYQVNYYTEDGLFSTIEQEYNSLLRLPLNDPIKEGHYLLLWEDENHIAYDETYRVTADLALYAVFKRNQYTITFYDGDTELGEKSALFGDIIPKILNPQKDGYSFEGWYTDKSFQNKLIYTSDSPIVEDNTAIYAKFQLNNIIITYKDNLQGEYQTLQAPAFSVLVLAPALTIGYKIAVQAVDSQGAEYAIENMEVTCSFYNIEITYIYEKDTFYLAFECVLLPSIAPDTIEALFEEAIILPTVEQYGYSFLGYYQDEHFSLPADYSTMPYSANTDKTTTLYIKLQKEKYNITFDSQGAQEFDTVIAEYMDSIDLDEYRPNRENMLFLGWLDSFGQLQEPFSGTFLVERDTLFTAVFQMIKENFNISFVLPSSLTFDLLDGQEYVIPVICPDTITIKYKETPDILPDPQAEGHIFLGWFTDRECAQSYTPLPIADDIILYGLFEIVTLTATFWCRNQKIVKNVEYYSPMPTLNPLEVISEYYTFTGWDKTVDYITEDIEFIALYTPLYNIVVLDKANQMIIRPHDCKLDAFLSSLDLALEEDEVFLGWKLEVYDQDTNTFAYVPNIVKTTQSGMIDEKDLMLLCSLIANLLLLVSLMLIIVSFKVKAKTLKLKKF